jgi:hypothetical protein
MRERERERNWTDQGFRDLKTTAIKLKSQTIRKANRQ